MLSLITGKQRSGKSFYVIILIVYYLRFSRRTICTNLPIYPDKIAWFASLGWKGSNLIKYREYLNRFHVFANYYRHDGEGNRIQVSRGDLKKFIKNSPDFWIKKKKGQRHPLMYYQEQLLEFWNHTPANSVIFLDEVYQFFSSMDFKDISDRRRQLLTYTRQHGHYKDDLFLISHNMADLDIHVRRGIQYKYEVVNQKYKNLIPPETKWIGPFMRGFKCPIQYFTINGFEYGEEVSSDCFDVWPDVRLFKCYDSHSKAETLNKQLSLESEEADSSDVGVNFWYNFKRFALQFMPRMIVIFGFFIGIYFCYSAYKKVTSSGMKVETSDKKTEKTVPKILYKMKEKIKYSDGIIIKKGGDYGVYKIVDIDGKFIDVEYFVDGVSKRSRIDIAGFREQADSGLR
jgi:hypothetical protein